MRVVKSLVVAVGFWLSAGMAMAESFEAGMAAYEAEDHATAFAIWQPLAEAGDPRAQYRVGRMYSLAEGVERDYRASRSWLTKAARQTDDPDIMRQAVYSLGYMVEYGWGGTPDQEKGECLYRVSAENNYPKGQFGLCVTIVEKPGINIEPVDWCEESALQGYVRALTYLGKVRITNPFRDPVEGYTLIAVAASKGDAEAIALMEEARTLEDPAMRAGAKVGERLAAEWQPTVQPIPDPPVGVPAHCWP